MRGTAFFGIVLCVAAGSVVALGQAQNNTPVTAKPPILLTNSPLPLGIAPIQPGSDKYNVHLKDTPVVQVLEELSRAANKKLILSDEVRQQSGKIKITLEFREIRLTDLMDGLTRNLYDGNFSLSWGNLGADTWLVVGRRIERTAAVVNQPFTLPPLAPPPVLRAFPKTPENKKMPPGSTPFWFNEQQLYLVPLKK